MIVNDYDDMINQLKQIRLTVNTFYEKEIETRMLPGQNILTAIDIHEDPDRKKILIRHDRDINVPVKILLDVERRVKNIESDNIIIEIDLVDRPS